MDAHVNELTDPTIEPAAYVIEPGRLCARAPDHRGQSRVTGTTLPSGHLSKPRAQAAALTSDPAVSAANSPAVCPMNVPPDIHSAVAR